MLSDRIKSLRIKSGISQAELARKLNVTRSSINEVGGQAVLGRQAL